MNRTILNQVQKVSVWAHASSIAMVQSYCAMIWIPSGYNLFSYCYFQLILFPSGFNQRSIHATAICSKTQSGKYKITPKRDRPLTYEMANPPYLIVARKSWNSWNCCKLPPKFIERFKHCWQFPNHWLIKLICFFFSKQQIYKMD